MRFENTSEGRLQLVLHHMSLSNQTRDAIERRVQDKKDEFDMLLKWARPPADRGGRHAASWHRVACLLIYKTHIPASCEISPQIWEEVMGILEDEMHKHNKRLEDARNHFEGKL